MRFVLLALALLSGAPALAGPGEPWTVDAQTSKLTFGAQQTGQVVSGQFQRWSGEIVLDPANSAAARIDIRIDMRSTRTNSKDIDDMLLGKDFFDVSQHPEARFTSTLVAALGSDRYEARGKLTIRDTVLDVALPFTLTVSDGSGSALSARARGRLQLKRLDYGVGRNEWAATAHIANEVAIELDIVASRPK